MKLTCVGTGSHGNCYVLESDGKKILLDLGIKWKNILPAIDYDLSAIDFALVTHRHLDHSIAVKDAIRNGIQCFGQNDMCTPLIEKRWSRIGAWTVCPIPVKHTNSDETECPNDAFIIQKDGERLLYMTDWQHCHYILTDMRINHFLIAVNYSEVPEGENRKHVFSGHASLDTVKDFLLTNMTLDTRSVIACHLSQNNADETKIYEELLNIIPADVNVGIAQKGKVFEL